MAGDEADGFMLEDRDRLPWLEPAEPIEEIQSVPIQKVIALVVLGLVLLGLIIGGGWWLKSSSQGAPGGVVDVISAPEGDYKIPADSEAAKKYDVDGKAFDGEGDAAYAASAGGNAMGRIDPGKAPEVPMTDVVKETVKPAAPKPAAATADAQPAPPPADLGGARVQLGAFNSKAIAEEMWRRLIKRFDEIKDAKHSVESVDVKGKTLYRLRMGAADRAEASRICGRLRVAGENCFVVP